MAIGLGKVLVHLQQAGEGQTDGQLLARFVATRDEASFASLVRRHGPMVLGVCRRILRDFHDAEDAFQATFLVLARKAASVVRRESVGCWLYQVAYHTALEASATSARRRSRERPMRDMPHPEVAPAVAQDWRPLLDRELNRLPEKYRAAVVLCDLQGRPRKEAARQLGVPEGTLSSRLATARQMLARRLAGCGVALSGGALAAAVSQGTASAQVPAALVMATAKAAVLVAAGQLAAGATPAALLMQGVMKAMLLKKLRLVVGAVMVLVAFGAVGVGYRAAGGFGAARAAEPDKPVNEVEALRKENELLKLNLQVVLEKVRAQEKEIAGLRKDLAGMTDAAANMQGRLTKLYNPALITSDTINLQGPTAGTYFIRDLSGRQGAWTFPAYSANLTTTPNVYATLEYQIHPWVGLFQPSPLPQTNLILNEVYAEQAVQQDAASDAVKDAECAVKALREAKDKEGQRRAAEALDKAMKKLREQLK
jgi:RNA polymerase sigma factor (sigma-70 family)